MNLMTSASATNGLIEIANGKRARVQPIEEILTLHSRSVRRPSRPRLSKRSR
jgi:hypothetical protein